MTARTSMAALITRTRRLTGDLGTPPVLTDQDIQDALDFRRVERRFVPLELSPTFQNGGGVLFLDYYAGEDNWEDDYKLQDAHYTDVTANADVSEPLVGHWHFPTAPQGFAVHVTGKTYDLYGAAADLLDTWAATVTLDFSFQNGRDIFQRQQKFEALVRLAAEYRKRANIQTTKASQDEITSEYEGGGVTYPSYSSDDAL